MEPGQKDLIRSQLTKLITSTNCNEILLAELEKHNILARIEVNEIRHNHAMPESKARRLYEILETKANSFGPLLAALKVTKQTGAVNILLQQNTTIPNHGLIEIDQNKRLGTGQNGNEVFLGTFDHQSVAVKVVREKDALTEVQRLRSLNTHKNIIRYFFAENRNGLTYIALELCETTLEDKILSNKLDIEPTVVLKNCTKGIAFLHKENVIHRDLKPTNILINHAKEIKISDFGLSIKIDPDASATEVGGKSGTLHWMAPEIVQAFMQIKPQHSSAKPKMSRSSDIFSLGCIYFFVMSNGDHPFGDDRARIYIRILENQPMSLPYPLRKDWGRLVTSMLQPSPDRRPTAENILLNGFFSTKKTTATMAHINTSLPNNDLIVIDRNQILGTGRKGNEVYLGTFDHQQVAVKVVREKEAVIEVERLRSLKAHDNIIRYYFAENRDGLTYVALELCEITLEDEIFSKKFDIEPKVILRKCTDGIAFLHSQNVIHRDLKPTNILINHAKQIKITDFGFSIKIDPDASAVEISGKFGTLHWMAPEVLRPFMTITSKPSTKPKMSRSSDIFSLGCIFFFVLSNGNHAFGTNLAIIYNRILENQPDPLPYPLNEQWGSIIASLLQSSPNQRPTAEAILMSECFAEKENTFAKTHKQLQKAVKEFDSNCGIPRMKTRQEEFKIVPQLIKYTGESTQQKTLAQKNFQTESGKHVENSPEYALGIHLGTSMCCVAVKIKNEVEIVKNRAQGGKSRTPSYVRMEGDGSSTYGYTAKDLANRYSESTIYDMNRMIGRQWSDPQVQNNLKVWPFEVVNVRGYPKIRVGKRTFSPNEVVGKLLSCLRGVAVEFLGEGEGTIKKVVLSVPCSFSNAQWHATTEAAESAGFEVLSILRKPTAAALAYKFEVKPQGTRNVLVYDFGKETFDVAIVEIKENSLKLLCKDGDTHLGGQDIDQVVIKYCLEEFKDKEGIDLMQEKKSGDRREIQSIQNSIGRLSSKVKWAKRQLANGSTTIIDVDGMYQDADLSVELTSEMFEEFCKPFIQKTLVIVDKALDMAKEKGIHGKGQIDEVILVGGLTKIPLVDRMLRKHFPGKSSWKFENPEEASAIGAAIQADILSKRGSNSC